MEPILWTLGIGLFLSPMACAIVFFIASTKDDFHPKCPECTRRIRPDMMGFGAKFECLCGVKGTLRKSSVWKDKLNDWIGTDGKSHFLDK